MKQVISQVPLRILHLEDEPLDTEIVREMLKADNLDCTVHAVATRPEFERALEEDNWSLILSDFSLPSFDGLEALALARAQAPGVPFILFSGTIGEETAVESLKNGATDYILKPGRSYVQVETTIQNIGRRRIEISV